MREQRTTFFITGPSEYLLGMYSAHHERELIKKGQARAAHARNIRNS